MTDTIPHRPSFSRDEELPSYRASVLQTQSLDIPQRIERKVAQYNASKNIFKRWLFEIVSWITSATCMGVIVGILLHCQGKPLSQRSLALASYNVLSKVASAALIPPISEGIGQLKWTWFHGSESKEMIDFEIFDKASRGAWGSFLLLFRTRGRSLAALGAILSLLLLASDTFFQQVTDYPDRWALEQVSSAIASVVQYEPEYIPEYFQGWETSQYDTNTMPMVKKYLYGNGTHLVQSGNSTRPAVPLSCPASNCTWPEYNTLAVCSDCIQLDVAEILTYACLDTTIDWSAHSTGPTKNAPVGHVCGYFLNATSSSPTLVSGYIVGNGTVPRSKPGEALLVRVFPLTEMFWKKRYYGTGSIHYNDLRNTLLDTLIVSARNGSQSVYSSEEPVVHECVLAWCVKSIKSSYVWGNYREEVTAISQNQTAGPWPWDSFEVPEEEGGGSFTTYLENITIEAPISSFSRTNSTTPAELFGASNRTAYSAMAIFDDFFPSYYTADSASATPSLRYKNYPNGPSIRALDFNPWQAPNDVVSHMRELAIAMTNAMRSNAESITMVPGRAWNTKQFVLVRWGWLTFPLTLLVLSLAFLVATIVKTSDDAHSEMGVWKTSAMPTLIYSLPVGVQKDLRTSNKQVPQVGSRARKVKIQLCPRQGWRVSGHIQGPQPPPGWI